MAHLVCPENQDEAQGVGKTQRPRGRAEKYVPDSRGRQVVQGEQRSGDEGGDHGEQEARQIDGGGEGARRGGHDRGRRVAVGRPGTVFEDPRFALHRRQHCTPPAAQPSGCESPGVPGRYLRLRRFLPGLKRMVLPGGMRTSVPVRGLRPIPFFRGLTWKTPKPRSSILSPRRIDSFMASRIASTATTALTRVISAFFATLLMISVLIIPRPPQRHYCN